MFRGRGPLRSLVAISRRTLYSNVNPNSKLLIRSKSPLEISCLPSHEADRSAVILPECNKFCVESGWKILQTDDVQSEKNEVYKIQVPAQRGDVIGSGYLEGNINLTTKGSFKADNVTGQSIDLRFGGTTLAVHSAYCETMNLNWIVPEEPPDGVTPVELPPISVYFGTLRGNATIELAGDANFNIGSFEGTMYMRQRFGNVAVHIGGPCPLLEIYVAEGNIELSLPTTSVGEKICGAVEIQASEIEIDRDALPPNCLDNWDLGEAAEAQTFSANFNDPDADSETIWRVRTLRGRVRLTGASWTDAMLRCHKRISTTL
uniref:DUF4097 domain-containing protein n=1 Tax=Mesocestoides corti TaxID=53468 RepID=A0A5K3F4H1_MESCO